MSQTVTQTPADADWRDEELWHRVNPGLQYGYPDLDALRQEAREAENRPALREKFRNDHLNVWLDHSHDPFVEMAIYDRGAAPIDLDTLNKQPCWIGVDMSVTTDLSAVVAAFQDGEGGFIVVPHFFCPGDNLRARADRDGVPYPTWAEEGFITPTPGNVIDYGAIEACIRGLCERFEVREIGFDPAYAQSVMGPLTEDGLPCITIRQGWVTQAPAVNELERAIIGGKFQHGGNPVLRWCFGGRRRDKAFANTKPTIEQSFAVLETAATRFVGTNGLLKVATGAGALGLVLATRLIANGLTPVAAGMLASARATASAAAAQIEFSNIVGTSILRLGAASVAARGFSAALALVGGPVSAALLGITVAATYYAAEAQEAEERSRRYAQALTDLKAKADAAASGVKGVGNAVAQTNAQMNAVEIFRLNQQLQQAEKDAAEAAESVRQFTVFVRDIKPPAGADQLKGFFELVEKALHGDAQAALAAQNAIADLANSNPDFQSLASDFNPLLEKLAAVRASVAATKAQITGLSAPAATTTEKSPFGALDVPGIKRQMGADYLKNRIDDAKNSDATRARQKMVEMLGAAGGTITPAQAYRTGLAEIAIEDTPSGKGRGGGGAHHKTDAEQAEDKIQAQIKSLEEEKRKADAEAATVGKSPAEKRIAEELAKNNVDPNSDDGRKIADITTKLEEQKAATERLEEARKKLSEVGDFMKDALADSLDAIIVKGESAQQVFKNLAQTLESSLLKSLLTGNGPFGGMFGGGGGLFGAVTKPFGFASGGHISGPGSGTSDSIPAMLSNGEFVVNARATKGNLGLLHALNSGKVPHFADGGLVRPTTIPSMKVSGGRGGDVHLSVNTTVNSQGGDKQQSGDMARQTAAEVERSVRRIVNSELRQQLRPKNLLSE